MKTTPAMATSQSGSWYSIAIEPPLLLQPGDKLRQIGSQILQERDGQIIAIRDIGVRQEFEPELSGPQTVSEAVFFRRSNVAGVTITYTGGTKAGESVSTNWSDGIGQEQQLPGLVQAMESINQNYDLARQLLTAAIIARDPTMNDPNRFAGSSISMDMAAGKQVQITLIDNLGGG